MQTYNTTYPLPYRGNGKVVEVMVNSFCYVRVTKGSTTFSEISSLGEEKANETVAK